MNERTFRWCAFLFLFLFAVALAPSGAGAQDKGVLNPPTITAYNPMTDKALKNGVWMEMIYVNNGYTGATSTGSWAQPYKTVDEALQVLNPATHVIFVVKTQRYYRGFTVSMDGATIWGQGYTPVGVTGKPRPRGPVISFPDVLAMPHGLEGGKFPDFVRPIMITGTGVEITGLSLGKMTGALLTISGGTAAYIHYNIFNFMSPSGAGILVSRGRRETISRNAFVGTGTGITLAGGSKVSIAENKFDIKGKGNAAIVLTGETPGLTVGSNDIKSQGYGIYADTAASLGDGANNPLVFTHNTIAVDGKDIDSDVAGIRLKSGGSIYAMVDTNDMSDGISGELNVFGVCLVAESGTVYCDMNEGATNVTSLGGDAAGIFLFGDILEGNYKGRTGMPTVHRSPDGEGYPVIDAEIVSDLGELNAAIDSKKTGWIYVKHGNYSGSIEPVTSGLYLWGEGLHMYGIGSLNPPVFPVLNSTLTINASNAAVMGLGFSISNNTGIEATGGSGIKILGNAFTGTGTGISVDGGKNIFIGDGSAARKNTISVNGDGVRIGGGTTGIAIDRNDIAVTGLAYSGIYLKINVPVSIMNNTISANLCGIRADVTRDLTTGPITGNNIMVDSPRCVDLDGIYLMSRQGGTLSTTITSNTIESKDSCGCSANGILCIFGRIGTATTPAKIVGNIIAVDGIYCQICDIYLDAVSDIFADISSNDLSAGITGRAYSNGILIMSDGDTTITSDNNKINVLSMAYKAYGIRVYAGSGIGGSISGNRDMIVKVKYYTPNPPPSTYAAYGIYVGTGDNVNPLSVDNNSGTIYGDTERYGIYLSSGLSGKGNLVTWDGTVFTPGGGDGLWSGNYDSGWTTNQDHGPVYENFAGPPWDDINGNRIYP